MSTSTVRNHKGPAVCSLSLRAKGLLLAFCALAVSLGLTTLVRAQNPTPANSTPLNDWIQDAPDDATQETIELFLDQLTREPGSIEWGKTINIDNLRMATWQREYSALSVWSYANQLDNTKATIETARAAAIDLLSRLALSRSAMGARQSARIGEIQSNLKQVNFTLKEAMADQGYLESRLASAKSDLRQAQADLGSAQRGLIYFNQDAPRADFAIGVAQQAMPWMDLGQEGFDVATNPVYRSQPAELNYRATKFGFDLGSTLAITVDAGLADILAPPIALYELHEKLHDLQLALSAEEHQRESESLAFGGVLSTARLLKVQFTRDYDSFSGSFRSTQSSGPLSVTGAWVSKSDSTFDRFSAASRYAFSGLETPSGHILTGYGIVSGDRIEQHDTFFNPLSIFDFRNNQGVTETTRRYESYRDSFHFNGVVANQRIQRAAEFSPHPNISIAPSATLVFDQENLRHPPSILPLPPATGGIYLGRQQKDSARQSTDKQLASPSPIPAQIVHVTPPTPAPRPSYPAAIDTPPTRITTPAPNTPHAPTINSSVHTKGKRPSTEEQHQAGQRRRKEDLGGEKGDERRRPPNKRPDEWKGPWPPENNQAQQVAKDRPDQQAALPRPGNPPPAPGGITFGPKQKYSDHQGTDKQFDNESAGAEVVPAKKKKQPQ